MTSSPSLLDHAYAIYLYLTYYLPKSQAVGALLLAIPLAVISTFVHELGHLGAARYFGVPSAIRLFPKKAERGDDRKYWFFAPLGVVTDDDRYFALSRWRRRAIVAAGPGIDVLIGLLCLRYGLALPVAKWVAVSVAFTGAMAMLVRTPINLVPIAGAKNDGWRLLNPDR